MSTTVSGVYMYMDIRHTSYNTINHPNTINLKINQIKTVLWQTTLYIYSYRQFNNNAIKFKYKLHKASVYRKNAKVFLIEMFEI